MCDSASYQEKVLKVGRLFRNSCTREGEGGWRGGVGEGEGWGRGRGRGRGGEEEGEGEGQLLTSYCMASS